MMRFSIRYSNAPSPEDAEISAYLDEARKALTSALAVARNASPTPRKKRVVRDLEGALFFLSEVGTITSKFQSPAESSDKKAERKPPGILATMGILPESVE